MSIGLTIPVARATGSIGYFETTETEVAAVREDIRSLLWTNWGERVNHYAFGCNFVEFLFESSRDVELKERIANRIISQVSTWMPFVTIEQLLIAFPEEDRSIPENAIAIRIKFRITNKPRLSSVLEMFVTSR